MKNGKQAFGLFLLFVVAFGIRLAAIQQMASPPKSDALEYQRLAESYMAGHGHASADGTSSTFRMPFYPLFLSAIYSSVGSSDYRIALVAQALLHGSLVVFIFILTRRIGEAAWPAWAAAALFALHPSFEIVTRLYRETLMTSLLLICLIFLYEGQRRNRSVFYWVAGLGAGFLGLINPVYIPVGFIWALTCWIWPSDSMHRLRNGAIVFILSAIIISPWLFRTEQVDDRSGGSHMKRTLAFGYYPAFSGSWWWTVSDMAELENERDEAHRFLKKWWPENQNKVANQIFHQMSAHPFSALRLVASRVMILWASPPVGSSLIRHRSPFLAGAAFFLNAFGVMVALLGLWGLARKRLQLYVFLMTALYLSVAFGATHAIRRYGYPLIPYVCIFFSLMMEAAVNRFFSPRRRYIGHS